MIGVKKVRRLGVAIPVEEASPPMEERLYTP